MTFENVRLLMITQDFPPAVGGIETYSAELARRFAGLCERFEVIAPRDPAGGATDEAFGFPVHRLPISSNGMGAGSVAAALHRGHGRRFDAVFAAHWYVAPAGLALRSVGSARAVFVAAHGRELLLNALEHVPLAGRAFVALREAVLARADRCFAVSRYTAALLERNGVRRDAIGVVPNGVDAEAFAPTDARAWRREHGLGDRPLLLTICRLVPRKGIDTVLRSLATVRERVPDACYVVGGAGPERRRLERLAAQLGVEAHVRFVGPIPRAQMREAFSAANVFVMPATSEAPDVEGFGLVFLEAGACGVPVVGARSGGVPDAIVHGETGALVHPGDVEDLAAVLVGLLLDPARARALGERGRARILAGFTWDHVAGRIYADMRAMIDDKR